tara:strand:+ start:23 stop:2032 length:2010 start_codon:yes stop_codon:yes gene_type:complete
MASKKKLLQAAAGSAGGAGLDVNEVFSATTYTGTGSAQTITNNIDLSGEGGLVWMKRRSTTGDHNLEDTVRGGGRPVSSSLSDDEPDYTGSYGINNTNGFKSNGFELIGGGGRTNGNGHDYISWTFRKAKKFFDVQTWTGNGSSGRTISHNLDSDPGMVFIKRRDNSSNWEVFHRSLTSGNKLVLNSNGAQSSGGDITATSSTNITVSDSFTVNGSGATYVGYFFAHNNNDGEFGPAGDQDIIKCGGYFGSNSDQKITLGFRPQFVMVKGLGANSAGSWYVADDLRGTEYDGDDYNVYWNNSDGESAFNWIKFESDGFTVIGDIQSTNRSYGSEANPNYAYMAIRKGSINPPSSATDVFAATDMTSSEGTKYTTGFKSDLFISKAKASSSDWRVIDRGREMGRAMPGTSVDVGILRTNATNPKSDGGQPYWVWDNTGFYQDGASVGAGHIGYNWAAAPSFCDVVPYAGNGSNRAIAHSLDATPEMMWVKCFTDSAGWMVYHKGLDSSSPATKYLSLNSNGPVGTDNTFFNGGNYPEGPNSDTFRVGTATQVNKSGEQFVAYLFASTAGVSKVGSYTGNGSSTGPTVDCGFSSGPRFVMIKRADNSGSWYVFDGTRGIVAGNDPYLYFNASAVQTTDEDIIDPTSSGFQLVTDQSGLNTNNENYIFYAIA